MKISINTSSFSFRFSAIVLIIISLILVFLLSNFVPLILFFLACILYTQKYTYIIPKKIELVNRRNEDTLKSLSLNFDVNQNTITTKKATILTTNFYLFTLLQFKFEKVYTVQGKYLVSTLVKYQRYN